MTCVWQGAPNYAPRAVQLSFTSSGDGDWSWTSPEYPITATDTMQRIYFPPVACATGEVTVCDRPSALPHPTPPSLALSLCVYAPVCVCVCVSHSLSLSLSLCLYLSVCVCVYLCVHVCLSILLIHDTVAVLCIWVLIQVTSRVATALRDKGNF
jgi:hypothetical protein